MANKVDISEVTDFSHDLQEASADFRSQLDKVKEGIEAVNGMSSFSGKTAKEAKQYFGELHITILESFRGLFEDRKSTRLNSSHVAISYAVFCLKKKNNIK